MADKGWVLAGCIDSLVNSKWEAATPYLELGNSNVTKSKVLKASQRSFDCIDDEEEG